jgi:hypothetical protein
MPKVGVATKRKKNAPRYASLLVTRSSVDAGGGIDPMIGMGPVAGDPAMAADMMEMRGEVMKAMPDLMMKRAQRMRATKTPPRN